MTWKTALKVFEEKLDACLEDRVITMAAPLNKGIEDAMSVMLFPHDMLSKWNILPHNSQELKISYKKTILENKDMLLLAMREVDVFSELLLLTDKDEHEGPAIYFAPGRSPIKLSYFESHNGTLERKCFVKTYLPTNDASYFHRMIRFVKYSAKALEDIAQEEESVKKFKEEVKDFGDAWNRMTMSADEKIQLDGKNTGLTKDMLTSDTLELRVHDMTGRLYTAIEAMFLTVESAYFDRSKYNDYSTSKGRKLKVEERIRKLARNYHPDLEQAINNMTGCQQYNELRKVFRSPLHHGDSSCDFLNSYIRGRSEYRLEGVRSGLYEKLLDIYETLLPKMADIIALTYDDNYAQRLRRMKDDFKQQQQQS